MSGKDCHLPGVNGMEQWPFSETDERLALAAEWRYMQACADYILHVFGSELLGKEGCLSCSDDGLCSEGAKLSEQCFLFKEEAREWAFWKRR